MRTWSRAEGRCPGCAVVGRRWVAERVGTQEAVGANDGRGAVAATIAAIADDRGGAAQPPSPSPCTVRTAGARARAVTTDPMGTTR